VNLLLSFDYEVGNRTSREVRFSGLKTAVATRIREHGLPEPAQMPDF
jgi:tRNA A37 threonylcarbamoyltransferase TsaD